MSKSEHLHNLDQADALARSGDLAAAIDILRNILKNEPSDPKALIMLSRMYRANAQQDDALPLLRNLCTIEDNNPWNWFELGETLEASEKFDAAANAFLKAWSLNTKNARFALSAGYALFKDGQINEALNVWSLGSDMDPMVRVAHTIPEADQATRLKSGTADYEIRKHFTQLYQDGLAQHGTPERLVSAIWPQTHLGDVDYQIENQKPYMFYAPDLPALPVFDSENLDWAHSLKRATPDIVQELKAYLETTNNYGSPYLAHMSDGEESWQHLRGSEDWNALHLFKDATMQSCSEFFPKSIAALQDVPLVEMYGTPMEAFFSVLKPNTHIPPHYGLSNSRLTAHLPLIIPKNCQIRVADHIHHWREGELFLFDDSFDHEARNDSDEIRIVLIFETWRPDLSPLEIEALQDSIETRSTWLNARKIPELKDGFG